MIAFLSLRKYRNANIAIKNHISKSVSRNSLKRQFVAVVCLI